MVKPDGGGFYEEDSIFDGSVLLNCGNGLWSEHHKDRFDGSPDWPLGK